MKVVIVEVCDANTLNELDIEAIIEEEFPQAAVIINQCLSLCGLCRAVPFAIVNNRHVHGKTPEQCLDKIRLVIKEELAMYE